MILLLFTSSYPYDYAAEYTFIQPELDYLTEVFDQIVLVPRVCQGKRFPLPPGVEVNEQYAEALQRAANPAKMFPLALSFPCFFHEIRRQPGILLRPAKALKLILFSSRAELTRRWTMDFVKARHVDMEHCTLYSYWFDHVTTGLAMLKREFPGAKLVSRAHGYDIYEEYYYPYYWPCRPETLAGLDRLFSASQDGKTYLCERYPEHAAKFETAHLGMADPAFVNQPSSDGIFRIVSCAHIVPVKRLDLLLDGVAAAAHLRPEQRFEWLHFGDGAGIQSLRRRVEREFPVNARGRLIGNVPNPEVLQYYRDHPVDVFVNVSSTEGGAPVSIQETISCGIPVIATSVGGNPEIVSERNGILLDPNPSPQEIAKAIFAYLDDPQMTARKRKGSREVWRESYNAEVNFRLFAERLKSIGER